MNQEQVKGKFDMLRGKLKAEWGNLTDNDIALAEGKKEEFFGRLKITYGLEKEAAQKRFDEIEKACGSSDKAA